MYNYDRLFVSIHRAGSVMVRGGKRPSAYYNGPESWNGEATKIDGVWVFEHPQGKFCISNPPHYGGEWLFKGNVNYLPKLDGGGQQEKRRELKIIEKQEAPKPKGVTLEELLAEDE